MGGAAFAVKDTRGEPVFVDIGECGEFEEGVARVVTVNGRQIGVIRWRDEVYALRNICPHEYAPVCKGYAMPMIVGDHDGMVDVDDDRLVIVCPWHGWEFDARSGRAAWGRSNYKLKTYPAKVDGDRVVIDVGRSSGKDPGMRSDGARAEMS
jgi:nitrite reductase/ring-hydroxylating ferredoxin subunit